MDTFSSIEKLASNNNEAIYRNAFTLTFLKKIKCITLFTKLTQQNMRIPTISFLFSFLDNNPLPFSKDM